jgi:hypothetical protein
MKRHQRGAALLAMFALLVALTAVAAVTLLRQSARAAGTQFSEQRSLAVARDALRGHAYAAHCANPALPLDALLPCPDAAGQEGSAAASCAGTTRGGLPWRTLQLPPLRDASGTCLWIERSGASVRIVAPGGARAGQSRAAIAGRDVCGGNLVAANYLDAGDVAVTLTLTAPELAGICP